MSDAGFVGVSPERLSAAADHLRDRAQHAAALHDDIRRAAVLADLTLREAMIGAVEIDEELTMLASLLAVRAGEAAGFRMPGSGWDFESDLLNSLVDDDGHRAAITGPLAITLLRRHRLGLVGDDEPAISIELLRAIAADPMVDPQLASAAAFLIANPFVIADATPLGIGGEFGAIGPRPGEIPLADLDLFLKRNDLLTATFAHVDPGDGWVDLTDDDLRAVGIDPAAFDESLLPRNTHDLTVAAIHHGTFTHSPESARAFLSTLPIHARHGFGLEFGAVGGLAVRRLADAATDDLASPSNPEATADDLTSRLQAIAHLPETTSGTRNRLITQSYADIAVRLGAPLNGDLHPLDPSFRGHNWFHLGVVASDSVAPVIRGDQTVYGFPVSDAMRAEIANGNQAIFSHFSSQLASYLHNEPVDAPLMREAFDLLDDAANTNDVSTAQHDVARSSILFALVEQEIVDPYLQLAALADHERLGTHALSLLGGDHRTPEQLMTDMGRMQFVVGTEVVRDAIEIGAPVPTPSQPNNLVDPDVVFDGLPDDIDWGLEAADDWSTYGERMAIIGQVAISLLTDPALTTVTNDRRTPP